MLRVGEEQLLHTEIGDAEDEHVLQPLAGLGIDGVRSSASVEAEELAVDEVARPAFLDLLRRLRQGQSDLVEILHRRHGCDTSTARRGAGAV